MKTQAGSRLLERRLRTEVRQILSLLERCRETLRLANQLLAIQKPGTRALKAKRLTRYSR